MQQNVTITSKYWCLPRGLTIAPLTIFAIVSSQQNNGVGQVEINLHLHERPVISSFERLFVFNMYFYILMQKYFDVCTKTVWSVRQLNNTHTQLT